jgi:hypothetical protein
MNKVLMLAGLVYFALPSVASPLCVFIDYSGEMPQVIGVPDFFCNEVGQFDLAGCGNDPVCRKEARDDRRNLFCDEHPDHPRCNKNNGTQESPTSCKDGEHRDENGQCVPSDPCDPSPTGSGFRARGALGGSDAECPVTPANVTQGAPQTKPQPTEEAGSGTAACIERNKFSSLVGEFGGSRAGGVAAVLEIAGPVSLAGDIIAIGAKGVRPGMLGTTEEYASGMNWVFRRTAQAFGSPGAQRVLVGFGSKVTPFLAVTGAFTLGYNATIEVECLAGILP